MLKQSHINNHQDQHHLNLYDKVRQDLFEEEQKPKQIRAPSITTIFLLQIQAYIVQMLLSLPPIHYNTKNNTNGGASNSAFFFVVIYQQQRLHIITSIRSIIRQCIRWVLLVSLLVLDNVARVLNVESEMYELTGKGNQHQQKEEKKPIYQAAAVNNNDHEEEEEVEDYEEDYVRSSTDTYRDDYYLQKKSSFNHGNDQCTNNNNNNNNKRNTNGILSEPSSPTHPKKLNGGANSNNTYSPSHSPTPNFIRTSSTGATLGRQQQQKELSPNLNPSRVNNRARSLSNNLDGYTTATKQQKLRRITGQREITLQNAILPIPSRNNYTSGKPPLQHHHHSIVKKASSVVSRSSSDGGGGGGNTGRPKMQKTQSLSTAHQYHHHHEVLLS